MEDNIIALAGHNYRIGKLSAMQQFHVLRRLAPLLKGFVEVFRDAVSQGKSGADLASLIRSGELNPLSAVEPIVEAISSMSDVDGEYVLNACLAVCARQVEGGRGWAPLRNSGGMMFADIDLQTMMTLTWKVLESNLAGFFSSGETPSNVLPQRG